MKKNAWAVPVSILFIALTVTGCHTKTMNTEKFIELFSSDTLEQQLKSTLGNN